MERLLSKMIRFDKYESLAKVGSGGQGEVWLARRRQDGLPVAIKILSDEAGREQLERFKREAETVTLLEHENVAKCLDAGWVENRFYIASEYLSGQTLESILTRLWASNARPVVDWSVHVIAAVLRVLQYAWMKEGPAGPMHLVHRDIKPSNIFVTYDGDVKLLDFGLGRIEGTQFRTKPGWSGGSLAYMAPEQLRGERADQRADIYAAGAVLFELLLGRPLLDAESLKDLATTLLEDEVEVSGPGVSDGLASVVQKAIRKPREARWQSAGTFLEALLAEPHDVPPKKFVFGRWLSGYFQAERTAEMRLLQGVTARTWKGDLGTAEKDEDTLSRIEVLDPVNAFPQHFWIGRAARESVVPEEGKKAVLYKWELAAFTHWLEELGPTSHGFLFCIESNERGSMPVRCFEQADLWEASRGVLTIASCRAHPETAWRSVVSTIVSARMKAHLQADSEGAIDARSSERQAELRSRVNLMALRESILAERKAAQTEDQETRRLFEKRFSPESVFVELRDLAGLVDVSARVHSGKELRELLLAHDSSNRRLMVRPYSRFPLITEMHDELHAPPAFDASSAVWEEAFQRLLCYDAKAYARGVEFESALELHRSARRERRPPGDAATVPEIWQALSFQRVLGVREPPPARDRTNDFENEWRR